MIDTEYWLNNSLPGDRRHCRGCIDNAHTPVEHAQLQIDWWQSRVNWGLAPFL